LKRLDDSILEGWFWNHHKSLEEESFGHDVSNPFGWPYIKYANPKPYLKAQ